jgi:hypothetical protein
MMPKMPRCVSGRSAAVALHDSAWGILKIRQVLKEIGQHSQKHSNQNYDGCAWHQCLDCGIPVSH